MRDNVQSHVLTSTHDRSRSAAGRSFLFVLVAIVVGTSLFGEIAQAQNPERKRQQQKQRQKPTDDPYREQRERLERMSPAEREQLEKRMRELKNLPKAKVEELRRKHQALQDLRKEILIEMPPAERQRMKSLSTNEYNAEMSRRIAKRREAEESQFVSTLPQAVRSTVEKLAGKERRTFIMNLRTKARRDADIQWLESMEKRGESFRKRASRIREAKPSERDRRIDSWRSEMAERADRNYLDRLTEKGVIDSAKRDAILGKTGFDRRLQIAKLRRQEFLDDPPRWYSRFNEAKRKGLEKMPAHRFFEALRDGRGTPGERPSGPPGNRGDRPGRGKRIDADRDGGSQDERSRRGNRPGGRNGFRGPGAGGAGDADSPDGNGGNRRRLRQSR